MNPSALDNAISALGKAISTLEALSDSLDFWLKVWTALVASGVAFEIIAIIKEHVEARRAWRRSTIRTPEKPSNWFFLFELLGIILVTAGIAGELWVTVLSGRVNSQLRIKNKELVGLVNQKAGFATEQAANAGESANKAADAASRANDSASHASDEAKRAESKANSVRALASHAGDEAAQAESKASTVGTLVDSANRKVQEMATRVLTTEKQLADEESKRAELEKDILPRTLAYTNFNGVENIAPLRKFSGAPISIRVIPDFEAHRAASSIAVIASNAGWSVSPLTVGEQRVGLEGPVSRLDFAKTGPGGTEFGNSTTGDEGVFVGYNGSDLASECAAIALVDFLRSNDWVAQIDWIPPPIVEEKSIPPRTVNVFVGFKATRVKPPDAERLEQEKNNAMSQQMKNLIAEGDARDRQECKQAFGP